MELNREKVFFLGCAHEIFLDVVKQVSMVDQLDISGLMRIRRNISQIQEIYLMIREEESRILKRNHGYFVRALGAIHVFSNEAERLKFLEVESDFNAMLSNLKVMANYVLGQNPSMQPQIDEDLKKLKTRFLSVSDPSIAEENVKNFQIELESFLTDETGVMNFDVYGLRSNWFSSSCALPPTFFRLYQQAGLYDLD